jgi:transglutaminase-like putative cysteine protease
MRWLLETLWVVVVVVVPALGVWLASSLAVYRNGPVWLAVACGLLLFPGLPLAWEMWSRRGPTEKKRPHLGSHYFTTWERLVLRTMVVNLLFTGALVAIFPAASFAALATRGDWFLEGRTSEDADTARRLLFATAGGLEWLYHAVRPNPYDDLLQKQAEDVPAPEPVPVEVATPEPPPVTEPPRPGRPTPPPPPPPPEPDEVQFAEDGVPQWPLPARLHPAVASLPPAAEGSIASVGRYLAQQEPNPWLRIKALHDYVADRVAYDVAAYRRRDYGPQDAATVFRTRRSVCAGYANLLAALGEAAGERIIVVGGDARTDGALLTGEGHAWNAARIGGRWVLIDATWDAGTIDGDRFLKQYRTDYLFTPPAVHGVTHFPEESVWQLRAPALSRGEFFRQPMMKARFFAHGLELQEPSRSQVTVSGGLSLALRNPRGYFLLADYDDGQGSKGDCRVDGGAEIAVRCDIPAEGSYRVRLYSNRQQYGTYDGVGEIQVHNRSGG